ncbi:MAG: ABC transporter permease [Acidobacteriaceae bacterium]|nr:ABC transporter permease [Acidobacteriaceae bacterium]
MSREEARRTVRLQLGNATAVREQVRSYGWENVISARVSDVRYACRRLRHSPGFTVVCLLTLAIAIGANSAVFSVINGILLKPLPYRQADELIDLNHTAPGVNFPDANPAPFLYFTYREQGRSFQSLGLYKPDSRSVTGIAEPEQARCLSVTAEILPMLGVEPEVGRWFSQKDDAPGNPPTMVLMHGWWQKRFGGDRSVIGRHIIVDGISRQVIGVMPARFRFLDENPAFLLPLQLDRNKAFLGQFSFPGIARLKPGVKIEQASADIARMIPIALHSFPPQSGLTVKVFEDVRLAPKLRYLKQLLVGDIGKTLWVLMGTLGVVLLIACANVANLLLVRVEGRQHELAVRAALGASWGVIARELLAETVVLGVFGGAVGLGLAGGAIRLLIAIAPANLPRLNEISIDPVVVLFTFAIALITGAVFGIIPIIRSTGGEIALSLRGGGRTSSQTRQQYRAHSALVVVQVALALVLLVGAGLMIRTFQMLRRVDPGFNPKDALTMRITIPPMLVKDPEAVMRLEQGILENIGTIPGVTSAGITTLIPTVDLHGSDQVYARDKVYPSVPPLRRMKFISPGLLASIGNRLIAGREFNWTDIYEHRPVAMLSKNLARELWGDPRLAIGKQITANPKDPWREVIGVVDDEREDGVQQKAPEVAYYPLLMNNFEANPVMVQRSISYVVRSSRVGSRSLVADVQQAVWSLNGTLPLANVRTLEDIYDKSLARTSFTLVMLAIAGAMALLIGLVGIYGVISYSVSQRRREVGIRVALGAPRRELARLFVGHGFVLALVGVAIGLAGAVALTRVLASLLFNVNPLDPLTYAAVSLGLLIAAIAASYIPTLRAMGVDPIDALRTE